MGPCSVLYPYHGSALRSLRRNVLRSALTTLGIIIGVGSLVAIAEIGKGAWTAIRTLLSKTGVDNIVVQAGAASRNGVSLGSGSVKTLTPEDAETILRECPSVDSLAPMIFIRRQVVHGNKNWVPNAFVGTTPGYLRVREWEDMDEGECFTQSEVNDAAMVCILGQTLARELFDEQSPVGQEVYVNDVPLRVVGVLSRKGADIIGEDQDDLLVAPWTTVKFRISSHSGSPAGFGDMALSQVGDASEAERERRYPRGRQALFPSLSPMQSLDSPRLERLSNVDSILIRAQSTEEIPAAMNQITECATASSRDYARQPRRLCRSRLHRSRARGQVNRRTGRQPAHVRGLDLARRRWNRDHEHHARDRDRTLPRNRPAYGSWCAISRHTQAIPRSKPSCSACSAARRASWPVERHRASSDFWLVGQLSPR